jgi:hypothetical protein
MHMFGPQARRLGAAGPDHGGVKEIHPRRAEESRHELVGGFVIQLQRRADLFHTAIA